MTAATNIIPISVVAAGLIIAGGIYIDGDGRIIKQAPAGETEYKVVDGGYLLPLQLEEKMLEQLVAIGVIDPQKMSEVTELNLLWAWGLANKNRVLESGPMMDPRYGGTENFASTGGWSAGRGDVMEHYSAHKLLDLSSDEQELVEKVARNTFRPCCRNPAYFPDCNHGMAMLGYLATLASLGAQESELNKAALKANNDWFPGNYDWDGPERGKQQNGGCSV